MSRQHQRRVDARNRRKDHQHLHANQPDPRTFRPVPADQLQVEARRLRALDHDQDAPGNGAGS